MSSSRKFNAKQFVGDLIRGAEAAESIDPTEFGAILIGALVNQLGPDAAALVKVAPKRRAKRKAKAKTTTITNAGADAGEATTGA